MYRGFIKDITNLAGQSLGSPELRILNLSINRDILSKATSEFEVINIPDAAQEGNVFGVYDDYGTTVYLGVINSINGNVIQCDQIISIFNDNWLWSDPKVATIEETLVQIIQNDFQTNRDEMVKTIFSQFDIVAGTTSVALQLPTQDENYVVNFMQFIFELYESYEILFDINISFNEVRPTITIFKPSFNTIKLGNNTNAVRNFDITTETFETNKIVVYSKDGETFRGEWYGTTSGITQDSTDLNRLPKINTKFIFSDDEDGDIVGEYLAEEMYNHKINVELVLGNKLYDFDTFKLGQVFDIFYNDKYYNSVLTGYKIQVDNEGKADVATLVFGKVRYSLENKLYKLTMNNNASSSSGGGQPQPSSTKFVKDTPITLYDTDETTVLNSENPQNILFYVNDSLTTFDGTIINETYSTNEVKTNALWVDNKPIYRKTIQISSLPNATATNFNHGISNVSSIWVDMSASFIIFGDGSTSPFNYIGGNNSNLNASIELRGVTTTKFTIDTHTTNRSSASAFITLCYTKTTD